ncbi:MULTISPECIES: hypothetical protein [Caballeronia]|uniref:hypothetical protein n=1 Tax=Caballeronia TaxID=1827195 RepID=UPI001FD366FA|nr:MULTISPECIES: hypothetical protein [Caballeronia]MDR5799327.1 hypothetical protein [Caballeronia sp. LZ001]
MRNRLLYHSTPSSNRENIVFEGLSEHFDRTGSGAVFLTDVPPPRKLGLDVWLVDASGLHLEPDHTGEPEGGESWQMFYGTIEPDRLTLEKIRLHVVATSAELHGEMLVRVTNPETGEESALYRPDEAIEIVRLAQTGQLVGSFLSGVAA